jgi:hypothetical protein
VLCERRNQDLKLILNENLELFCGAIHQNSKLLELQQQANQKTYSGTQLPKRDDYEKILA